MRTTLLLVVVFGAMAFAYACSKVGKGTTTAAASYEGPIASTDAESGAEVYAEFCEGCHPGGQEGDGPAITGLKWSPAKMRQQIREGDDDMPAFGLNKISDEDLEALLAYSVTLEATEPNPAPAPAEPTEETTKEIGSY